MRCSIRASSRAAPPGIVPADERHRALLAQGLRGQPHRHGRDGGLHADAVRVPAGARGVVPGRSHPGLRGHRAVCGDGSAATLPVGRGVDPARRPATRARVLDHRRDRRRDRGDLVLEHVLGRAGHRVLPHLSPRVPLVDPPEGLRARHARRGPALLRGQRADPDAAGLRRERRRGSPPRTQRDPGPDLRRLPDRRGHHAVRAAVRRLLARAARPHPVALRLARRARRDSCHRDRRLRLPALPEQRQVTADRHLVPVHHHRARLVLCAGADRARGRGRQRAPVRARPGSVGQRPGRGRRGDRRPVRVGLAGRVRGHGDGRAVALGGRLDDVLDALVGRAGADHHQRARAVARADGDVRGPRRGVQVVARAHPALVALDDRDAFARQDQEALLLVLRVVEARRVPRPQDVHADPDRAPRRARRLEHRPRPAALVRRPLGVREVEDEPAVARRPVTVFSLLDLGLVHAADATACFTSSNR